MKLQDKRLLPANVRFRNQLKPGDIGYITYLHGILYAQEYGWDYTFETYVAVPLAEFAKEHNDRERIWIVEKDGHIAGSVAIVEASLSKAQLRWMLLTPELRGVGLGRYLVETALDFCKQHGIFHSFPLDCELVNCGNQALPIRWLPADRRENSQDLGRTTDRATL